MFVCVSTFLVVILHLSLLFFVLQTHPTPALMSQDGDEKTIGIRFKVKLTFLFVYFRSSQNDLYILVT